MMRTTILLFSLIITLSSLSAQKNFTHQDTLRGSITPERSWWDLIHYDLSVEVIPSKKALKGKNIIQYKALEEGKVMQIDLQAPMQITKVTQGKSKLKVKRDGNAHFVYLKKPSKKGAVKSITVHYEGIPTESTRPPWDGGLTWAKDNNDNDLIVTTCQGDGASIWWPCKDHMYDEVDSMRMHFTVPEHLVAVGNGRHIGTKSNKNGTKTYSWKTVNPINNYGVNINVGDYVHFGEVYKGENGSLDCSYYVLRDNLQKAKAHFKQVPGMLAAFEHWFGPYPFYEDSYKLVEVPYPGMEHQSSVTYGNGYKNGYGGRDVSGTGWGYNFDFIMIHETGHEWFANNITYKDVADMWVHEGFTAYSENLYLDYHYGKEASAEYVIGTRKNIRNDRPIIGPYNVNKRGSGDMYYKGSNILHTLRTLIDDDEKWRSILRGLNKKYYHATVTTQQIEEYISEQSGMDLKTIFDQYLRSTELPYFDGKLKGKQLKYRWKDCNDDFNMPYRIFIDGKAQMLYPTTEWQTFLLENEDAVIVRDFGFYVKFNVQ